MTVFVRTKGGAMLHVATCSRCNRATAYKPEPWAYAEGMTVEELRVAVIDKGIKCCGICRPLAHSTKLFPRLTKDCEHPDANRGVRSWQQRRRDDTVTTTVERVRRREWCQLCGFILSDDWKPVRV